MQAGFDLIIVGEGIAGLTCAAECAARGLTVATIEAAFVGGLVVNVNELARFDEARGLSGMDHAAGLASANLKAGVRRIRATVTAVHPDGSGFQVQTDAGGFSSRFVVIASGARLAKLGVPGEAEHEGRGVSQCADCDAPLFSGAEVVVAGAGDWALQEALLLAREGVAAVHLVFREAAPTACPGLLERARAEPGLHWHPGCEILRVLGDAEGLSGVEWRDAGGKTTRLAARGLFVLPRLEPNSDIAPPQVRRDEHHGLLTDDDLETAVPGLWAIGQVRAGFGGWLAHAAADARRAAEVIARRAR